MGSPARGIVRLGLYLIVTLALTPVQFLALWVNRHLATEIPMLYHRLCCRILGLKVVAHGAISNERPTLFVCNHVSYIDIAVLASLIRGSFIAKAEVARWPLFGILAKLQRTVFISRRGTAAARHRDELAGRLANHENLILFPEGTSNDGIRVLSFKSALFSVAQQDVDGRPLAVQPVSIAYTRLDGMPMGRNLKAYYAWYGDMALLSHFWGWVGLGTATVEVVFHPLVSFAEAGSRKGLAEACQRVIAESVAASNAGLSGVPAAWRA